MHKPMLIIDEFASFSASDVAYIAEEMGEGPLPDENGYLDPPLNCGTFAEFRMPAFDQEGPREEPTSFDVNHKPRRRNAKRVRSGGST